MLGFSLLGRVILDYICRRRIIWKQSKVGRCIGQELRLACIHKPEKMLAATLEPQVWKIPKICPPSMKKQSDTGYVRSWDYSISLFHFCWQTSLNLTSVMTWEIAAGSLHLRLFVNCCHVRFTHVLACPNTGTSKIQIAYMHIASVRPFGFPSYS